MDVRSGKAVTIAVAMLVLVYATAGALWPDDDADALASATTGQSELTKSDAVSFDAVTALASATVTIRGSTAPRHCTWVDKPGRFRCGKEAWAFVGPHTGRSGGRALRCLWMHPHAGGATTVVRWKAVNMGSKLHARLSLLRGSGDGSTVQLTVLAGGERILSTSASDEWRAGEAAESIAPGDASGSVTIELRATNNRWRMACVEVWMTGQRRPGAGTARLKRPEPARGPTRAEAPHIPARLPKLPKLAGPPGLPDNSTATRDSTGERAHVR